MSVIAFMKAGDTLELLITILLFIGYILGGVAVVFLVVFLLITAYALAAPWLHDLLENWCDWVDKRIDGI